MNMYLKLKIMVLMIILFISISYTQTTTTNLGQAIKVCGVTSPKAWVPPYDFNLQEAKSFSACARRPINALRFNSESEVEIYLFSIGYHRTVFPGCGHTRWSHICTRDYTLSIRTHGCTNGVYRYQAGMVQVPGGKYSFTTQGPEPNPELLSYAWPASWWPFYVHYWHQTANC